MGIKRLLIFILRLPITIFVVFLHAVQSTINFIWSTVRARLFNSKSSKMVVFGLGSSFFLAIVAFMFEYEQFRDLRLCYAAVGFSILMSSLGLWPFINENIKQAKLLGSLIVQAGSLIMLFAAIYRGHGLKGLEDSTASDCGACIGEQLPTAIQQTQSTVEPLTALYFSIVTWTTLGYGDLQPKDDIQLIAAFQAILGYLFLGLIVAVLANLMGE